MESVKHILGHVHITDTLTQLKNTLNLSKSEASCQKGLLRLGAFQRLKDLMFFYYYFMFASWQYRQVTLGGRWEGSLTMEEELGLMKAERT